MRRRYLFKYGEKENPWEKLEQARVKNIKKELADRVVGQDEAIEKIEKTVVKAYMGLTGLHKTSSRSMPKGVFFFVGPTGVGKTELSKALAKFLFGDEQACIRFDMSEYAQENSDQKLIGAAPGYVGYEEGGQYDYLKNQNSSIISDLESLYSSTTHKHSFNTLRDFLASIRDYFIDWRYSYDSGALNVNLNTLSDVLNIFEDYSLKKFIPISGLITISSASDGQSMSIDDFDDIIKN